MISPFLNEFMVNSYVEMVTPQILRKANRESLNRMPDISDWRYSEENSLLPIMRELEDGHGIHRKSWEYAQCIHGFRVLGAEKENAVALAVGAGYERPLFYYANKVKKMVATDLYNNPEHEGKPEMLTNPEIFAPFSYQKENLEVLQMDGSDLKFDDNIFDFVFSLSSIEHFGSRERQKKSMQEIHRVVKPGGKVCIITELIISGEGHPEFFSLPLIRETLIDSTGLKLIGDLDLRISEDLVRYPIDLYEKEEANASPHIVLKLGDTVFTSLSLFFEK